MVIGTEVAVFYRLRRDRDGRQRMWVKDPMPAPMIVCYIGYRWLSNGVMEGMVFSSYEGEPEYHEDYLKVTEHFKAALVVENERVNPFYVRWEDMIT
jgi:hypothetical protein